ncbi:MAG: hypothetical protein ACBR12_01175 [Microcoleus sp.]
MLAKPAKILRNAIAFLTTNRGGVMKGDRSFCRKGRSPVELNRL